MIENECIHWNPSIPRSLITYLSVPGDRVLGIFEDASVTIAQALSLNRYGIPYESSSVHAFTEFDTIENLSIDLICGRIPPESVNEFANHITDVMKLVLRVLRPNGIVCLQVMDFEKNGRMVPLGLQMIHRMLSQGFTVKSTKDTQSLLPSDCRLSDHEYLLIFQRPYPQPGKSGFIEKDFSSPKSSLFQPSQQLTFLS